MLEGFIEYLVRVNKANKRTRIVMLVFELD